MWASLVAQMMKNLPAMQETWFRCLGWEDPWRRERLPTPVFLPGEVHGQRSLAGCNPWRCKESDTTEWLTHRQTDRQTHTHTVISVLGLEPSKSDSEVYAQVLRWTWWGGSVLRISFLKACVWGWNQTKAWHWTLHGHSRHYSSKWTRNLVCVRVRVGITSLSLLSRLQ